VTDYSDRKRGGAPTRVSFFENTRDDLLSITAMIITFDARTLQIPPD
jgi:hypothetical protein